MSRGPGRWQRAILAALDDAGNYAYVNVSDTGLKLLDRSMTPSEYRGLNRAAWLLRDGGALHVGKRAERDYLGRPALRLVVWTCAKCSHATTSEHIPVLPCFWCSAPTEKRNLRDYPDCGCKAVTA